jgi:hypothetical protein
MTSTEILIQQTESTYDWIDKLIGPIPFEKWDQTPNGLETNLTWQIGHLLVSHYFHSIMVITGHQSDLLQEIPLRNYADLFTDGSPANVIGQTDAGQLLSQLRMVQKRSLDILKTLTDADLESVLEPTPLKHPIARIKGESIGWNIKHTMYHCGQIGILKRVVYQRHDFGLRK